MRRSKGYLVSSVAIAAMGLHAPASYAAVRSADAIPTAGLALSQVQNLSVDDAIRCVEIGGEFVKVDEAGRVLLDVGGEPFGCRLVPAAPAAQPWYAQTAFIAALVATFGVVLALTIGNGSNDSPG